MLPKTSSATGSSAGHPNHDQRGVCRLRVSHQFFGRSSDGDVCGVWDLAVVYWLCPFAFEATLAFVANRVWVDLGGGEFPLCLRGHDVEDAEWVSRSVA